MDKKHINGPMSTDGLREAVNNGYGKDGRIRDFSKVNTLRSEVAINDHDNLVFNQILRAKDDEFIELHRLINQQRGIPREIKFYSGKLKELQDYERKIKQTISKLDADKKTLENTASLQLQAAKLDKGNSALSKQYDLIYKRILEKETAIGSILDTLDETKKRISKVKGRIRDLKNINKGIPAQIRKRSLAYKRFAYLQQILTMDGKDYLGKSFREIFAIAAKKYPAVDYKGNPVEADRELIEKIKRTNDEFFRKMQNKGRNGEERKDRQVGYEQASHTQGDSEQGEAPKKDENGRVSDLDEIFGMFFTGDSEQGISEQGGSKQVSPAQGNSEQGKAQKKDEIGWVSDPDELFKNFSTGDSEQEISAQGGSKQASHTQGDSEQGISEQGGSKQASHTQGDSEQEISAQGQKADSAPKIHFTPEFTETFTDFKNHQDELNKLSEDEMKKLNALAMKFHKKGTTMPIINAIILMKRLQLICMIVGNKSSEYRDVTRDNDNQKLFDIAGIKDAATNPEFLNNVFEEMTKNGDLYFKPAKSSKASKNDIELFLTRPELINEFNLGIKPEYMELFQKTQADICGLVYGKALVPQKKESLWSRIKNHFHEIHERFSNRDRSNNQIDEDLDMDENNKRTIGTRYDSEGSPHAIYSNSIKPSQQVEQTAISQHDSDIINKLINEADEVELGD